MRSPKSTIGKPAIVETVGLRNILAASVAEVPELIDPVTSMWVTTFPLYLTTGGSIILIRFGSILFISAFEA